MKKVFFFVLTLMILSAASVNAQVTIGSEEDPRPGSVLDLQSGGSLGLLLPSVTLTDATLWAPVEGSAVEGMTVFHNTDDLTNGLSGKGIYVWSNGTWSRTGASATQCVNIAAAATQATFTGDIGTGKTLEVVVSAGSAPFNYNWYRDGVLLQTVSNKTDRKDSYTATDYGTYTCEITNACSLQSITFSVTEVNVGDFVDNPAGVTWGLNGISCFDVRDGYGFPASSQLDLVVTGATVTAVNWLYDGQAAVLSGSAVESTSGVTLPFQSQAAVSAAAVTPLTVTVTALITLSTGDKVNVAKAIKFQNQACCDGAIIYASNPYKAAWNYVSGSLPGDGAKAGGASNTGDASWSPNITATGPWNATALDSYFTNANIDLCVYKKNYKSSGDTNGRVGWANAVNNCANGTYADGDPNAGWYLPNMRELQSIYQAIGGAGSSALNFTNLGSNGTINTTAEDMVANSIWSSTEYDDGRGLTFGFDSGLRDRNMKNSIKFVRCVRRL
jgi:hypothetical protein